MKMTSLPKTRQRLKLFFSVVIVICVFTLAVSLLALSAGRRNAALLPRESAEVIPTLIPTAAPAPTTSPSPALEKIKTSLKLSPSEDTLTVTVCGENGEPIQGTELSISVKYPDGTVRTHRSDTSGTLCLTGLSAGGYSVTLTGNELYADSPEAGCTVMEKLEYKPIEHVSATTQVLTVSQIPVNETLPTKAVSEPLVIEEISTAQTVEQAVRQSGSEHVMTESSSPVVVEQPGKSYTYNYSVGANGFLLLADGSESDVRPVEENGVLSYGISRVVSYYAPDGSLLVTPPPEGVCDVDYFMEESSRKVSLILSPGVPDSAYAITAVEVREPEIGSAENIRVGWFEENGKKYYYDASGRPVTGLKRIDGKLYFFNTAGVQGGTLGLDVSYFNGAIDWNKVRGSGIEYVIVRVAGRTWGSGKLFEDENSYTQGSSGGYYLQQAKAAGLKVGAYVYSNAINTNEAVEEASLASEIIAKSGVGLDMPVYLDLEYSGDYPSGRADKLTPAERSEIITAFCTTVQAGGYSAGIYIGDNFLNTAIDRSVLSPYSVWYANYTNHYALPKFTGYNIWQFTASGVVDGISGYADLNIMF